MVGRRTLVRIGFAVAPAAAVAFACTFPDVEFASSDGGASGQDATIPDGSAPIGDGGPAIFNEASVRSDAEALVDAGVCAQRTPCDCDEDGYASSACDGGAVNIKGSSGANLMLGDCDDLDRLRNPGAPYRAIEPPPGRDGDWNCDGVVDSVPKANFACPGNLGLNCSSPAVKGPPRCGTEQLVYKCVVRIGTCQEEPDTFEKVFCQ
jgi:hypothetical protein